MSEVCVAEVTIKLGRVALQGVGRSLISAAGNDLPGFFFFFLLNSSETWPPTPSSSGAAVNTILSSLDAQRLAIAYEEASHSNDSLAFHGCNTFWFTIPLCPMFYY